MKQILVTLLLLTVVPLCFVESSLAASSENNPEATLQKYFDILTNRNTTGIENLMDTASMTQLKKSMDSSMRYQANFGVYQLQRRIFGKKVSTGEIAAASPQFYLKSLAGEILEAARSQHLVVDSFKILGKIDESEDMVHMVARLEMHQDESSTSDIQVYTLVREQGAWKLKFPATIKQMISVIESSAKQVR